MTNLVECKECSHQVSAKAKTCPSCGVKKPGERPATTGETLGGFVILAVIIGVIYLFWPSESDTERTEREAREAAEQVEREQKGFHCLSSWDGSHREVTRFVKDNLKDPSSFEHVETRITPVNDSGEHALMMQYRANNSFGGKVIGNARATIKNSDCSAVVTLAE